MYYVGIIDVKKYMPHSGGNQSIVKPVIAVLCIVIIAAAAGVLLWQYDPLAAYNQGNTNQNSNTDNSNSGNNADNEQQNNNSSNSNNNETNNKNTSNGANQNGSSTSGDSIDFFKNGAVVASGDTVYLSETEVEEIRNTYSPVHTSSFQEIEAQSTFYTIRGSVDVYQIPASILDERIFNEPHVARPDTTYTALLVEATVLPAPVFGQYYLNWIGVEYNGTQQLWYGEYLRGDDSATVQYAVAGLLNLQEYPHIYYFMSKDSDEYDANVIDDELLVAKRFK